MKAVCTETEKEREGERGEGRRKGGREKEREREREREKAIKADSECLFRDQRKLVTQSMTLESLEQMYHVRNTAIGHTMYIGTSVCSVSIQYNICYNCSWLIAYYINIHT